MSIINIEGLGDVEIAGDTPTPEEARVIMQALELEQISSNTQNNLLRQNPDAVMRPTLSSQNQESSVLEVPDRGLDRRTTPAAPASYMTDRFGMPTTIPIAEEEAEFKKELIPQMVGGIRDATQNTLDLLFDDLGGWLESKQPKSIGGITWVDREGSYTLPRYLAGPEYRQHLEAVRQLGFGDISDLELPEVAPAKTGAGQLTRTATQFFVPYMGALKVLGKGKTALGTAMKMEAGAVLTGQAVFDPFDEKLSDLIQSVPALENPVTEYLQADPDDSVAEARFKLALEDIGLGAASLGIVQSLKALGKMKKGQVEEGLSDADEALANLPRTEEAPLPDEVLSNGGKLDPEATASQIDELDAANVEHVSRRLMADQAAENIEDVPVTLSAGSQVVKTNGPKYAGNINLDRIETSGDIESVIETTADNFEGLLEGARRGTVKDEQLIQLASDLNMSVEDLLSRRPGELWNAEKILAARQLMLASATKVRNAAIDASRSSSDADLVSLKDAFNVHVGIQEQVAGLAAEAGRALRQFRLMPGMNMDETLFSAGGRKNLQEIADMISVIEPNDLANFNKTIKVANDPTMTDKFFEYWINGLLSGYKTHAVNAASNALTQLTSIPEKYLAAGWGALRGADKTKRITFGEANTHALSLIEGIRDGFRLAKKTLITGEPSDLFSKLESRRHKSIKGLKGEIIRLPGRLLMTSDEFFKGIGYRMELNSLAYRDTIRAGIDPVKNPRKFAEHYQKIIDNPPKKLDLMAMDVARDRTFTKPLGSTGQKFQGIAQEMPAFRVMAPFIRTPVNILKYAGRRTPLGIFSSGFKSKTGIARDEAMGRMVLGTGGMAAIATMASQGKITGSGPTDPVARARQRETGWQPYSFAIEQEDGRTRYLAYNRIEPMGILFGLAADSVDMWGEMVDGEKEEVAAMLGASVSQNLLDKTFFKGISDAVEAVSDPDRFFDSYLRNQAGTLVPTFFAQTAQNIDPMLRETRTLVDKVKSRVPGFSETVPARRNLWGEPIILTGGLGPDFISPIYSSYSKEDPVSDELVRLSRDEGQNYWPGLPQRTIDGEEIPVDLYLEYQTRAGQLAHRVLSEIIQTPGYKNASSYTQKEIFRETINEYRGYARDVLRLQLGSMLSAPAREKILSLQREQPDLYGDIQMKADTNPAAIRRLFNDGINFSVTGEDAQ